MKFNQSQEYLKHPEAKLTMQLERVSTKQKVSVPLHTSVKFHFISRINVINRSYFPRSARDF